jgi:hypothetical protein
MRRSHILAIPLAASFALASAASAGTLITPLAPVTTNNLISCFLANGGTKAVQDVVVELLAYDSSLPASVVRTQTYEELAPLRYTNNGFTNEGPTAEFLCRFTFKGSGKSLRGSSILRENSVNVIAVSPAS